MARQVNTFSKASMQRIAKAVRKVENTPTQLTGPGVYVPPFMAFVPRVVVCTPDSIGTGCPMTISETGTTQDYASPYSRLGIVLNNVTHYTLYDEDPDDDPLVESLAESQTAWNSAALRLRKSDGWLAYPSVEISFTDDWFSGGDPYNTVYNTSLVSAHQHTVDAANREDFALTLDLWVGMRVAGLGSEADWNSNRVSKALVYPINTTISAFYEHHRETIGGLITLPHTTGTDSTVYEVRMVVEVTSAATDPYPIFPEGIRIRNASLILMKAGSSFRTTSVGCIGASSTTSTTTSTTSTTTTSTTSSSSTSSTSSTTTGTGCAINTCEWIWDATSSSWLPWLNSCGASPCYCPYPSYDGTVGGERAFVTCAS